MNPQAIRRWERILAQGPRRYILLDGLLVHGFGLFVVALIVERDEMNPRLLVIFILLSALGGALFGAVMWAIAERQYRKALQCAER